MKFISTAAALLAATISVSAKALDVWAPKVLSPKAGDVWASGQTQTVTWDLSSQPAQITNNNGLLLLRQGDADTPLVLANDFLLTDGNVTVTVPDVVTGDDYSVTLIGDSGDHSDTFTINGVFSF